MLDESHDLATVTTRRVAARVGLSTSAFFRYHASRDSLVASMAQVAADQLNAVMRSACTPGPDPRRQLQLGIAAHIRYALEHSARYGLLTAQRPHSKTPNTHPGLAATIPTYTRLLAAVDSPDMDETSDGDLDLETAALLLLARVHGAISLVLRHPHIDHEAAFDFCTFLTSTGLG